MKLKEKPAEAGLKKLFPKLVLTQEFSLLLSKRFRRDGGMTHRIIRLKENGGSDAMFDEVRMRLEDRLLVRELQQDEIAVLGNLKLASSLRR